MSDYVPKTKDFTNAPLCLSGHGVTKVFGLGEKKTVAVDHVDFDFHEGEFVSIVGESGSGKTTLSKMLLGLLNQTEGEILFQGKPRDVSSHRKKKEYWRGIQAIFQDPSLPSIPSIKLTPCFSTALTCAAASISPRRRRSK